MLRERFPTVLTRARRGNAAALDELFVAHYPVVERMAHRALRAEDPRGQSRLVSLFSTRDIVQDVCRKLLSCLDAFDGTTEAEFVSYLATAVKTRLLDMVRYHLAVRRDRRRTVGGSELLEQAVATRAGSPQPGRVLAAEEELQIYFEILDRIPARERVLLVRRLEGRATHRQLADELGYPSADAARKAFCKAHAKLLRQLERRGVATEPELRS